MIAKQLLICLAAAHVLGDFALQSDEDADKKQKWSVLLKHTLVIALLSYLLAGM